jgi:hypothetical protein
MKHKPAMYALLRLHADLGGRIKNNRQEAVRLASDMGHVEAVIRMLEPSFDVTSIAARRRYKANPLFRRGEGFRIALGILRAADGPLTTREIAVRMLRGRGVTAPTLKTVRDLVGAVHASLRNNEGKTIESQPGGRAVRWSILRPLKN